MKAAKKRRIGRWSQKQHIIHEKEHVYNPYVKMTCDFKTLQKYNIKEYIKIHIYHVSLEGEFQIPEVHFFLFLDNYSF